MRAPLRCVPDVVAPAALRRGLALPALAATLAFDAPPESTAPGAARLPAGGVAFAAVLPVPVFEAAVFEAAVFEAAVLEAVVREPAALGPAVFEAAVFEADVLEAGVFDAAVFEAALRAPVREVVAFEAAVRDAAVLVPPARVPVARVLAARVPVVRVPALRVPALRVPAAFVDPVAALARVAATPVDAVREAAVRAPAVLVPTERAGTARVAGALFVAALLAVVCADDFFAAVDVVRDARVAAFLAFCLPAPVGAAALRAVAGLRAPRVAAPAPAVGARVAALRACVAAGFFAAVVRAALPRVPLLVVLAPRARGVVSSVALLPAFRAVAGFFPAAFCAGFLAVAIRNLLAWVLR